MPVLSFCQNAAVELVLRSMESGVVPEGKILAVDGKPPGELAKILNAYKRQMYDLRAQHSTAEADSAHGHEKKSGRLAAAVGKVADLVIARLPSTDVVSRVVVEVGHDGARSSYPIDVVDPLMSLQGMTFAQGALATGILPFVGGPALLIGAGVCLYRGENSTSLAQRSSQRRNALMLAAVGLIRLVPATEPIAAAVLAANIGARAALRRRASFADFALCPGLHAT